MESKIQEVVDNLSHVYNEIKEKINFNKDEKVEEDRKYFINKFSKEKLVRMTPEEALDQLMNSKNLDSLVYHLEFKNDEEFNNRYFGGIGGGSAGKYTIFHSNKYNQWVKWEAGAQVRISDGVAAERADTIRNNLLKLHDIIENNPYDSIEDIRNMIKSIEADEELKDFYRYGWVHKYLSIFYPNKLSVYHGRRMFKSLLVKIKHPFGDELSKDEMFTYFFDFFYTDLAKRVNISQNDLSKLVWEIHPDINSTTYNKVELSKYSSQDLDEMVHSNFFYAPLQLEHDFSDITSLKEMRSYLEKINYTEYKATHVNLLTKSITNKDLVLLVDKNKAHYVAVIQGEYEYLKNEKFKHRLPAKWLKINKENQFKISGKISKFINRVHQAQDQVKIEMAVDKGKELLSKDNNNTKSSGEIIPFSGIMKEINSLLIQKKQIILNGAPGTGKSYWALKTTYELIARQQYQSSFENLSEEEQNEVEHSEYLKMIVLHSNYGYEEFVEGIRPVNSENGIEFQVVDGVFKKFAKLALDDPDNDYYMILDEINRADLTKIFGELIYSIESTKQDHYINLAHSNTPFTVPKNLYIIGTMNNADKSVSLIDLA